MTIKAIDAIRKRIDDLEARLSDSLVAVVVTNQGNQKATLHFGDPTHTISDIPSVSSYYPTPGQSVRVQRSGDTLLILGATTFIEPVVSNDEQPTTGYPGQMWSDPEGNLFRWENGAWVPVNAADPTARDEAGSKNRIYMQDDIPLDSPVGTIQDGDTWYDTNDGNKLYVWQGGVWTLAQDVNIPEVVIVANDALISANGKNRTYYQASAPTGGTYVDGDLWFDTDDGNKPYTRQGSSWVTVQDATIAANLSTALTAANGKSKNYYQTSAPTGGTYQVGDTWFNTASDNAISRWNGTSWAAAPLGMNALGTLTITNSMLAGSIDAGKITTGTLNAANVTISNLSVTNSMIASGIDAGKITVGTLSAARITTTNNGTIGGTLALDVATATNNTDAFKVSVGISSFINDVYFQGNVRGQDANGGRSNIPVRFPAGIMGSTNQSVSFPYGVESITADNCVSTLTSSSANAFLNSAGLLVKTSWAPSSLRYKENVADLTLPELDPKLLLSLKVKQYTLKQGIVSDEDCRYGVTLPGFIAEEIAELYPVAAEWDDQGRPDSWHSAYLIPGMLWLIQHLHSEIQELKEKVNG